MAEYSRILAWEISWTEEPGRLQSMRYPELDTIEQVSAHIQRELAPTHLN